MACLNFCLTMTAAALSLALNGGLNEDLAGLAGVGVGVGVIVVVVCRDEDVGRSKTLNVSKNFRRENSPAYIRLYLDTQLFGFRENDL